MRYKAFMIMRDLLFCLLFLGRLACRNTGFVVVSLLFDSAHCILHLCSFLGVQSALLGLIPTLLGSRAWHPLPLPLYGP